MEELDAETAISAEGWDARYAVALVVAWAGGMSAALIDTNGDESDINLDQYEHGADGHWRGTVSGSAGDGGTSWTLVGRLKDVLATPRIAATWGRAVPGAQVDVKYLGHRHSVITSGSGWWLFIAPATEDSDAVPRPIAGPS